MTQDCRKKGYKDTNYQKKYHKRNKYKSQKSWQKLNPKYIKGYLKEYRKNKKTKIIFNRIKTRSQEKNLEWDLDEKWIQKKIDNGRCEITNIKFEWPENEKSDGVQIFSFSIDRIDSDKGYLKTNCQAILWGLNIIKSNMNDNLFHQKFKKLCEDYLSNNINIDRKKEGSYE